MIEEITQRLSEPTPPFWKKLRRIGLVIATVGTGVVTTLATGGLAAPAWVITTGYILIGVGTTMATTASLATGDTPPDLPKPPQYPQRP